MLSFDYNQLSYFVCNLTRSRTGCHERALSQLLQINGKLNILQRFGFHGLLLISDQSFLTVMYENKLKIYYLEFIQHKPVKFPNAMLLAVQSYKKDIPSKRLVFTIFSNTILLFANASEASIGIGCLSCFDKLDNLTSKELVGLRTGVWFPFAKENIPSHSLSNFDALKIFWKTLHKNLYFPIDNGKFQVPPIDKKLLNGDEEYEIVMEYLRHQNCSDLKCGYTHLFYYHVTLQITSDKFGYFADIFPFAHRQIDYTFQILFPKETMFSTNLDAF